MRQVEGQGGGRRRESGGRATSCRCASFFLADRLRCFSRTAQYFSVSLSYFFFASWWNKQGESKVKEDQEVKGQTLWLRKNPT